MRRKPGTLVPFEEALCLTALDLKRRGFESFYGYLIAKELETVTGARRPAAFGTLYRALNRLHEMGILDSSWEDPQTAAETNRPRRRLYSLTEKGLKAAAQAQTNRRGVRKPTKVIEA
jgi:DNA-binding PadR family transcriptional regulator